MCAAHFIASATSYLAEILHKFRQEFISLKKAVLRNCFFLVGVLITDLSFKKTDSYAYILNCTYIMKYPPQADMK